MKYTHMNTVIIIFTLCTGIISLVELSIFFAIWLLILFQYRLWAAPFLTLGYLFLQQFNVIFLIIALICTGLSIVCHVRGRKMKEENLSEAVKSARGKRSTLCIVVSALCLLISVSNILLYGQWPWIYWR